MIDTLHPCVRPRRRFVLSFLSLCVVLSIVLCICLSFHSLWYDAMFLLGAGMLAIPSRTSHGTLMQLVGLVVPLSDVVILFLIGIDRWFPSPEKVPWTELIMIPFGLVTMAGLFLYPLGFGLICWLHSQSTTK